MDQYQRQAALSRFRTPLKNAWMLAEITAAEDTTSGGGRPQINVRFAPCVGNVPQRDLEITGYIPKCEPDDDPQTLKNIKRRAGGFVRAVDPEFPRFPKKAMKGVYDVKDTVVAVGYDGTETTHEEGTQVGFKEYDDICRTLDARIFRTLDELGERAKELVGMRIFIKPGKAKFDEEYGLSQFIDSYAGDLGDTPVETDNLVDEDAQAALLDKLGLAE